MVAAVQYRFASVMTGRSLVDIFDEHCAKASMSAVVALTAYLDPEKKRRSRQFERRSEKPLAIS